MTEWALFAFVPAGLYFYVPKVYKETNSFLPMCHFIPPILDMLSDIL